MFWGPPVVSWRCGWTNRIFRKTSPGPISHPSLLCISISSLAVFFNWFQLLLNWGIILKYGILSLLVTRNLDVLLSLISRSVICVTISILWWHNTLSINHVIIIFILQSWSLVAIFRIINWLLRWSVSIIFIWHSLSRRVPPWILVISVNFYVSSRSSGIWWFPLSSGVWWMPRSRISPWLSFWLLIRLIFVGLVTVSLRLITFLILIVHLFFIFSYFNLKDIYQNQTAAFPDIIF